LHNSARGESGAIEQKRWRAEAHQRAPNTSKLSNSNNNEQQQQLHTDDIFFSFFPAFKLNKSFQFCLVGLLLLPLAAAQSHTMQRAPTVRGRRSLGEARPPVCNRPAPLQSVCGGGGGIRSIVLPSGEAARRAASQKQN